MIPMIILAFACTALAAVPTVRPKRCPGGYEEGATAQLGRYWYECREGQLTPKGCMDDDGRRIPIFATFDTSNKAYRMQCIVDSSGYLAFTYKSCLYNGRERVPDEEWEDGRYYYKCNREGDYLRINPAGCIDEGRHVKLDEKVVKGDFVYQCKKSVNGTCSMCPVACSKFGHEYAIGESFEIDNLLFTCTNKDSAGPIAIKCIGCVNDQRQRLKDGDRYFQDEVVYECTVREEKAGVEPVGCVQRDQRGVEVERRLGCYWQEGDGQYQYEMNCKYDASTKRAVKVQNRCMYKIAQGSYSIDPGCYQIAEKTAIACKKESTGQLTMRAYSVDEIGQLTLQGLRFC